MSGSILEICSDEYVRVYSITGACTILCVGGGISIIKKEEILQFHSILDGWGPNPL